MRYFIQTKVEEERKRLRKFLGEEDLQDKSDQGKAYNYI